VLALLIYIFIGVGKVDVKANKILRAMIITGIFFDRGGRKQRKEAKEMVGFEKKEIKHRALYLIDNEHRIA
jgi:hypothetical protein